MSYKKMENLAKSLSTYKVPRLTLFGNAVNLVSTKGQSNLDAGATRVHSKPPKPESGPKPEDNS